MSDLERFEFPTTGQPVRTLTVDAQPWFVSKDACDVIGISKHRDAVAQLDDDERASMAVDTLGGRQQMSMVNEAGLYALMMISRSEKVKPFRRWITHEVLPAIRKTGSYSLAPQVPQTLPEALRAYADEVESHVQTRAELAEAAPKADAWEVLASAKGDYSAREAAHILNRDPSISTGQNRLFQTLRDLGLVDKRDIPYAHHSQHLVMRSTSWRNPKTGVDTKDGQVRITADGLRYLRKRLGAAPQLPGLESLE